MRQLAKLVATGLLLVSGGAGAATPAHDAAWVGRRVVMKTGAVLRIGRQVVHDPGAAPRSWSSRRALFRVYRVEQASGPWFWLVPERDGFRGWIKVEEVVPYDRADAYFTSEIHTHPRDPSGYLRRGNHRLEEHDAARAIVDFEASLRLDPRLELAHCGLGRAHLANGEPDHALRDFDTALKIEPDDAVARYGRAQARQAKGQLDQAIADYDAVIRLDPRNATVFYQRGRAWQVKGDLERALADLDEAIRLDSGFAPAHVHRALVQEALGNFDQAVADLDSATRLDPRDATAFHHRGHLEKRRGEYSRAIVDYEEAIRLAPDDPAAYNDRAWLWATCRTPEFRDGPRAVTSAMRACALTGWKEPGDLDTLAAACAEAGDFDAAAKWQEKAIELYQTESDRQEGRVRLALYQSKKPFHEGPPAR